MSNTPNWYGPNTNTLSERRAAAHKRNVEAVAAPVADVVKDGPPTAKQIAYRSGVADLESIVLRIEALEEEVRQLKAAKRK